jgi:hypothetical protein
MQHKNSFHLAESSAGSFSENSSKCQLFPSNEKWDPEVRLERRKVAERKQA